MTSSKIVPMGNSLGVRIPKSFLEYLGVNFKDASVVMELNDDSIIIKKQDAARERRSYKQIMEDFYHKPIEEIDVRIGGEEIDWGDPVGDEIW